MRMALRVLPLLLLGVPLVAWGQPAATEQVGTHDDGGRTSPSTHQCPGHQILTHNIGLENSRQKYSFQYSGCIDPSHNGEHPSAEGNFGMPTPCACNWYHSGFLTMDINGKDVVRQDLKQMQVIESGARGEFQVVWAHPDAEVALRTVLLPGENHVLCLLKWQPVEGHTLKNVTVRLRCYPSFFTSAMHRRGERHVKTPRTDQQEPSTLTMAPGQDPWLLYYDTVFDVAKGEGEGPCAAIVEPAALLGGKVSIGDYAVMTEFNVKPAAGSLRLGLYDLCRSTNAEAIAYLQAHGNEDLVELLNLDFRPGTVRGLDVAKLKVEAGQLIADAADDGAVLKPKVEGVLKQVEDLSTRGQAGDWQAEAQLAGLIQSSQDLFWRLKTFAVLNRK